MADVTSEVRAATVIVSLPGVYSFSAKGSLSGLSLGGRCVYGVVFEGEDRLFPGEV